MRAEKPPVRRRAKPPRRGVRRLFVRLLLLGVGLGAFGAHGLKATLEAGHQLENWKTAVFYQLAHAVALLALANLPSPASTPVGLSWILGVCCFSGSLYWIALGGPVKLLWPVTPIGGLLLLAGWAFLTLSAMRKTDA